MANRNTYNSSSGVVSGGDMLDNIAEKLGMLFNAMVLKQASIAHSGNDYTITIDPVLNADVVEGMGFYVMPDANNTGAVRLRITDTNPYYDVVKVNGAPLSTGEFLQTSWYLVVFLGGEFVIMGSGSTGGVNSGVIYQEFLSSGVWNKPTGLSDDAIVDVELWGGGGGGGSNSTGGGGGGGEYVRKRFRAGDLTSSVSVTVGNGGAADNPGGQSSFGAYAVGYPGGAGQSGTGGTQTGGGGGGPRGAGAAGSSNGTPGLGSGAMTALDIGNSPLGSDHNLDRVLMSGYSGAGGSGNLSRAAGNGTDGGGGGGSGGGGGGAGGSSINGGGGGGGGAAGTGGPSKFGGAGGNQNVAGSVPGGGGGRNAAGGAGKVIVRVTL